MEAKIKVPKTQMEAIQFFANLDNCHTFMMVLRWPNGITCPLCGSEKIGKLVLPRRIWNCNGCKKQFSAKVRTIFEDSPLGLDKWLTATWMIVNAKNGISSYELHRSIGVTQKTGWFMLHRIRLALQEGSFEKFSGRVEADETYIGAKARNMHKGKRPHGAGTGMVGKTAVLGLLERNVGSTSRVRCKVTKRTRVADLDPEIRANVEKGSELITDSHPSYYKLADEYAHKVIDHAECYAKGHVHTNCLENFWSLLKRAINGTYVSVEPFHLFRYLDEQAYRFNERKGTDSERFVRALATVANRRLTYKNLIGKAVA
jgi:transposase-like protein